MVGHQRIRALQPEADAFGQRRAGQKRQAAQVLVPQAAHILHRGRVLPHADEPPGVNFTGRKVQGRHLRQAVAEPVVRRARRHVTAADVRQRDLQQRGRRARGKYLIPVPQHKHRVGTVLAEIIGKALHRIADGARSSQRRAGAELQDGDARRDGHAVGFDLADGVAELRRKMRARHHKAHGQRAALRQLFYNAAQQAVRSSTVSL